MPMRGDTRRAVIAEPLQLFAWQLVAKTPLHSFQDRVEDITAAVVPHRKTSSTETSRLLLR